MEGKREICFVIMPFSKTTEEHDGEYWTKSFDNFLKPLIEENQNFEARRSEALRGDILQGIITSLVTSSVVVADLTDGNPNVYWELGVRQSFKHCTITIAEFGTHLPFDVSNKGTLFYYPKDHIKMSNFRKSFREVLQDCLIHSGNPDSYVLEAISGRGTLFEIFNRDQAIRRLDAVISENDRNLLLYNHVLTTAKKNQKNPPGRSFVTARFSSIAVELLIVDRYVEEEKPFLI